MRRVRLYSTNTMLVIQGVCKVCKVAFNQEATETTEWECLTQPGAVL